LIEHEVAIIENPLLDKQYLVVLQFLWMSFDAYMDKYVAFHAHGGTNFTTG
jgi:hypothetical protein